MKMIDELEYARSELQARLDNQKTQHERNRLGQFATPPVLAQELLAHARDLLPPGADIRFLDPAIGTGAFYSALRKVFPEHCIREAVGFEVDAHYGTPATRLWHTTDLVLNISDFTRQQGNRRYNLVICNPPYVRHHHISNDEKARLQSRTTQVCGVTLSGLSGLYCYFMGLAHAWLADGGVAGWLIPSEFMDVNYGQAIKRYLLERVTLLHVHRFDPSEAQFADALVSSAVVWFRNSPPPRDHAVKFTFGGSLSKPALSKLVLARALAQETKWTRFPASDVRSPSDVAIISDYFKIQRGVATGDNSYFILSAEEISERCLPRDCFRPILPSPRYVKADEIEADTKGHPLLDQRLFLLDTRLPEDEIQKHYPTLWRYLEEGMERGLHERYLCSHRTPWYRQEDRPPAPIVCTYLGRGDTKRGRPFRFILNHSMATVANVYLAMYPKPNLITALRRDPTLLRRIWEALNRITPELLLGEGRVYGGGLHKLEPKELAHVPLLELASLLDTSPPPARQTELFRALMAE